MSRSCVEQILIICNSGRFNVPNKAELEHLMHRPVVDAKLPVSHKHLLFLTLPILLVLNLAICQHFHNCDLKRKGHCRTYKISVTD